MIRDEEILEVPVLVIGAGAAGLAAAITLARYGIECLLVERRHEQSRLPRATVISTRSMELVRSWGLEEEVVGGGVEVEWLMWLCETLAQASAGEAVKVGLPTREQSAMISPTAPACVPQDHLEPVLLAHLRSLEPARVELATELMALESRPTGVRATVRHNRNGHVNVVEAQYLVAADGAYSRVRTALEIGMDGPDDIVEGVTTIFRAPLWDTLGDHRYGIYAVSQPEAPGSFLPAGREDRWVYGFWKPNELHVPPTEERLTELIRLGAGVPDLRLRIERSAMFSAVAQLADRYRHENVFLAGDAAHRVTPRGGTGMNTAIHDGYDIGWKLAWVLRGWARPTLLDTYEAERRPVAEHNAARSADPDGSRRNPEQELHADLHGRIAHHWVATPGGRVSTLDLLGPGLTLYTGPDNSAWLEAAASHDSPLPVAAHQLDQITARALGIRTGGALLTRPDGTPAGWWQHQPDATSSLLDAVSGAGFTHRVALAEPQHARKVS